MKLRLFASHMLISSMPAFGYCDKDCQKVKALSGVLKKSVVKIYNLQEKKIKSHVRDFSIEAVTS